MRSKGAKKLGSSVPISFIKGLIRRLKQVLVRERERVSMSLCSFFRDLCILTTNPFLLFWSHHPDPCWFGTLLYVIGLGKLID